MRHISSAARFDIPQIQFLNLFTDVVDGLSRLAAEMPYCLPSLPCFSNMPFFDLSS
jgi:hypothetical protein